MIPLWKGTSDEGDRRTMTATATPPATTPAETELPLIISVDDHILEPRTLWQEQLPARMRDKGPKVVRERLSLHFSGGHYGFTRDAPDGTWCDLWLYDDLVLPTGLLHAAAGIPKEDQQNIPAIYEDFREATYDQKARLADMGTNPVEAGLISPNMAPRFAGQGFSGGGDKVLALRCLQISNGWMNDDWCGG